MNPEDNPMDDVQITKEEWQAGEIARLEARVKELEALYAPFRPMSLEEAERELDAIEAEPMEDGEVEHMVKYATNTEYRAEHLKNQFVRQSRASRGLRAEIARLKVALADRQKFKDFVHEYFDSKGVPHHPPGTHGEHGCRIGDRMDWVWAEHEQQLAAAVKRVEGLVEALRQCKTTEEGGFAHLARIKGINRIATAAITTYGSTKLKLTSP